MSGEKELEETKNYYRGLNILCTLFAEVFADLFKEEWKKNNDPWEDGETFGEKLNKIYVDYKTQKKQKIGKNLVDDEIAKGQTKIWDLTTLHRVYSQYNIITDETTQKKMTEIKDLRNKYNHAASRSLRRTTEEYTKDLSLFEGVFKHFNLDLKRLKDRYSLELTDSEVLKLVTDVTVNAVIFHEETEEETTEAQRLAEYLNNSNVKNGIDAHVVAETDVVLPEQSHSDGLTKCLTEYEVVFIFVNPDSQTKLSKFKRSVAQFESYINDGFRCMVVLTKRNIETKDKMPIEMSYKSIEYFQYKMTRNAERAFLKCLQNDNKAI